MTGIDNAAAAFQTALDGEAGKKPARGADESNGSPEVMFGNLGNLEVDENSPLVAGGDADVSAEDTSDAPADDDAGDEDDTGAEEDAKDGEKDEAEEEAEDEAEEDDKSDVYEVTVDGVRTEVTLREALDGYIRTETFHRRMNELNDVKDAIRNEAVRVLDDRKKYVALIDQMKANIDALVPAEPNWDEEYAKNPTAARALQRTYEEFGKARARLDAERARVTEEQLADDEKRHAESVAAENVKILNNFPHWKDEKAMRADLERMASTAKSAGFTDEEIRGIVDSRLVTVLHKASKWDDLQAKKPKPIRRGMKPVKPGAGNQRTAPKDDRAMSKLRHSGSVEDAAAVFKSMLNPRK